MSLIIENYLNRTNTFIRFILVGLVNTCIGLSIIFLLMNVLDMSYWISTFIGNSIGAIISYYLNKKITFNSRIKNSTGMGLFILVVLMSYCVAYQIGYRILINFDLFAQYAFIEEVSVLVSAVIYTSLNYLGQRFVTFK